MTGDRASAFKAGLFVLLSGMVLILAVIALGQRTQIFVPQYRLTARFTNVAGLIRGAAVRVAGVNVGTVRSIEVINNEQGTGVVRVGLEIAESYKPFIRTDSRAAIRTVGALGDRYIEISTGSQSSPVLTSDSTIKSDEPVDFYEVAEQASAAIANANKIANEVAAGLQALNKSTVFSDLQGITVSARKVLDAVQKGPGLAHSAVFDPELPQALIDLRLAAKSFRETAEAIQTQKGLLGELIHGKQFSQGLSDMADAAASAKNILGEIEKGKGTAHALVYEPGGIEPITELGEAARRLNQVVAEVQEGKGTLGLLIADPSIWESLKRLLGGAEESRLLRYMIRTTGEEK